MEDAERFRVGSIEGVRFVHGRGRGTPSWMFPDVPAARLAERIAPYVDAEGTFGYVMSSALVWLGGRTVLLDASLPGDGDRPASIERHLAAVGVRPSDVDTVVITHGHADHVGGLVSRRGAVFPRARHVVHRDELRGAVAAELAPLTRARLVDAVDHERDVLPGLRVVPAPGHTPGHLVVAISSGSDTAFYVGDLLAHEVNVAEPGWNHFSDGDLETAARSRRDIVERARRSRALVIGSHVVSIGRVVSTASGAPMLDAAAAR